MATPAAVLAEARLAQPRTELAEYIEAIKTLREKKWSWREIADFLKERGVDTDHTKLLRFMHKQETRWYVPDSNAYYGAVKRLRAEGKLQGAQWDMLLFLYSTHNRTSTYTELAHAAGRAGANVPELRPHVYANSAFGKLGKLLGETLQMDFQPSLRRDAPFYSSSIGVASSATPAGGEFELVMHHELAKALERFLSETNDAKGSRDE